MTQCKYCKREGKSKRGNGYHQNRCYKNPNKIIKKLRKKAQGRRISIYTCPICGVVIEGKKYKSGHITFCSKSLGDSKHKAGISWNDIYGKDEADKKRKKLSDRMKKESVFVKEGFWTEERRLKASESKKELYNKYPDKHPNRKLAKNKVSFPEKQAGLELNRLGIYFISQYKVGKYFVDFCVKTRDQTFFIEVDGGHFHTDVEKDNSREREILLIEQGTFIRLPAKKVITNLYDLFINKYSIDHTSDLLVFENMPTKKKLNKIRIEQDRSTKQKQIEFLRSSILESDINFSKFGWVKEASIILNLYQQKVHIWMKKNMKEFYETKCFHKKSYTKSIDIS
jgi:very-short-patch-repair endonuclease